ncbi:aminotransferase class V-fold PLP-dependent enzyme [Candidatus Bathyarchaeota archaeon]|nr:aminotransferase class V-fold PLP-dependent enzyme [Candidatus Bathyarchaeota archaeon]
MSLNDLSDDFPICKTLNYLNAASIGPVPQSVIDFSTSFSAEIARGGTKTLSEEKEDMVYDGLRDEGGKLFGCSPEDVAVFNSVSEALNCIAWSLELDKGKLISTNIEFPSVTYPALRMAQKEKGITTKLVSAVDWHVPVEDILEEIDETTKAVFITHVENLTGQVHDIKRISERAHEVGAMVIVDGIQAAGYIPLDVKKLQIDAYITGSYKWLCSPFGTGMAYVSKELYDKLTPLFVGWRTAEEIWDFDPNVINYPSTARKFEYSTSAYGVKLGMVESIKYLRNIGIDKIYEHDMKLDGILREELGQIEGVDIITIDEHGPIVTFKIEGRDSREINNRVRNLERPVELSVRLGLIRVSPHLYNTVEDIAQLIDGIRQVV